MSVIATALKHLIAAGLSGEALLRAVEELEAVLPSRSAGAERQARYRNRRKASAAVTRNARDDGDGCDESNARDGADAPPNDIYSNPPVPPSPDGDGPPVIADAGPDGAATAAPFPPRAAVAVWNEMAQRRGLSPCRSLAGERLARLKRRIAEHGEQGWREAVAAVEKSRFLLGETGRSGWKANIDFLLVPTHFAKALEGGYGNDAVASAPAGRVTAAQHRATQVARAALYERLGRVDEAAEIRRELAAGGG